MSTITVKISSPDKALSLLNDALDREKRVIMGSLKATGEKVRALAEALGVDVDKLMRGEVLHSETDDMKLIELEGEITLLRHFEAELKELESIVICR